MKVLVLVAAVAATACAPRMLVHPYSSEICVTMTDGTKVEFNRRTHTLEFHDGELRVYDPGMRMVLHLTPAETRRVESLPCEVPNGR